MCFFEVVWGFFGGGCIFKMLVVIILLFFCVDFKGVVIFFGDGECVCVLESDVVVGGVLLFFVEIVDGRVKVYFLFWICFIIFGCLDLFRVFEFCFFCSWGVFELLGDVDFN